MGPPKKDAFADLFQSASYSHGSKQRSTKMSLSDAQKLQEKKKPSMLDSWSGLDSLAGSRSNTQSPQSSSLNSAGASIKVEKSDPFSFFDEIQEPYQSPITTKQKVTNSTVKATDMPSLLDDDFVDAFPQNDTKDAQLEDSYDSEHVNKSNDGEVKREKVEPNSTFSGQKDETLAQLIEIGFDIDRSVEAINAAGDDLQSCVNYIMDKERHRSRSSSPIISGSTEKVQAHSKVQGGPKIDDMNNMNDIADRLGSMSMDFMNKASIFLNKSKNTVMKNIEQFQAQHSQKDGMPIWMHGQHEHKGGANQKKDGTVYEDYGTDGENINHEAIISSMDAHKKKEMIRKSANQSTTTASTREKNGDTKINFEHEQHVTSTMNKDDPITKNTNMEEVRKGSEQKNDKAFDSVDLLGITASSGNTSISPSTYGTDMKSRFVKSELDEFMKSDYDTAKQKATVFYNNGDYDNAIIEYNKSLNSVPPNHELFVVISSNLAICYMKIGDYKNAKKCCDQALDLVDKDDIMNSNFYLNQKPLKTWYIKLVSRKAECLEMLESFKLSLDCYKELISLGVNDKKVMEGRRRMAKIVEPSALQTSGVATKAPSNLKTYEKTDSVSKPKPAPASDHHALKKPKAKKLSDEDNLSRFQAREKVTSHEDALKEQLREEVERKIFNWSNGNEGNLRTLLTTLPDVLPEKLGFPFLSSKKIQLGDLMLTKKVKLNYMKVIGALHPDKTGSLDVESRMLCEGVFVSLNKSWDLFKEQNGIS